MLQARADESCWYPADVVVILLVSRRMLQEWPLKVQEKQELTEPFARGWV
jgi:hypothetical protein